MREELQSKSELFVENRNIIHSTFKWDEGLMVLASALLVTNAGVRIEADRLKECYDIVKANTGAFSEFRGNVKLPIVCKMALSDEPKAYFDKLVNAFKLMKKAKWISNEFRLMSAITLVDKVDESKYEMYVDRTIELYGRMKKEHSFLTSDEDIPYATILAVSDIDVDILVENMEACYSILKKKFSNNNAVQSLSHILALSSTDVDTKCAKVVEIFDGLKAAKHKFGTGYELASLGTLAVSGMAVKEMVSDISMVDDFLKTQKGFGGISLDSAQRRLFAAQVVLGACVPTEKSGENAVISSMLALTIAIEIAVIVCICGSIAATNAATT